VLLPQTCIYILSKLRDIQKIGEGLGQNLRKLVYNYRGLNKD
jgi:hypothetical protein